MGRKIWPRIQYSWKGIHWSWGERDSTGGGIIQGGENLLLIHLENPATNDKPSYDIWLSPQATAKKHLAENALQFGDNTLEGEGEDCTGWGTQGRTTVAANASLEHKLLETTLPETSLKDIELPSQAVAKTYLTDNTLEHGGTTLELKPVLREDNEGKLCC